MGCVHGGTLFAYRNVGTAPLNELLDTSNTCATRQNQSVAAAWLGVHSA